MEITTKILISVVALIHGYIMWFEMFAFHQPKLLARASDPFF